MELEEGMFLSVEGNKYIIEKRANFMIVSFFSIAAMLAVVFIFVGFKTEVYTVMLVALPMLLSPFYFIFHWEEIIFNCDTRSLYFKEGLGNHYYGEEKIIEFKEGLEFWVCPVTCDEGITTYNLWARAKGKQCFIAKFVDIENAQWLINTLKKDQPQFIKE